MATEAVKWILNLGKTLSGRLMLYDSLAMHFREVRMRKDPQCVLCCAEPSLTRLADYAAFCAVDTVGSEDNPGGEDLDVEVSVQGLKQILDSPSPSITLLDVRETHEWEINRIEGAVLTPLSNFESFIPQLDKEADIYLYCYKGKRSLTALEKLRAQGFTKLHSVAGGIDAWCSEIDKSMPRY